MKKTLITLIIFSIPFFVIGQYNETIRTARPGQAVGPFTTGKYVFQVQTGIILNAFDDNTLSRSGDNFQHVTSLRYGLLENFEIRSAFRFRSDEIKLSDGSSNNFGGLSFWNVGFRYNLVTGGKYQPSFGLQTDMKLTWIDEDYQAKEIAPKIMLIHGQKLSDKLKLTTNWAVSWNGNNNIPKGNYVINLSFPISNKLGGFVENFGEVAQSDLDTKWDAGLFYLINNNLLIDLSGGFGSNNGFDEKFIEAGLSWRIKLKETE